MADTDKSGWIIPSKYRPKVAANLDRYGMPTLSSLYDHNFWLNKATPLVYLDHSIFPIIKISEVHPSSPQRPRYISPRFSDGLDIKAFKTVSIFNDRENTTLLPFLTLQRQMYFQKV